MLQKTNLLLHHNISSKIQQSVLALQYADDTALITVVDSDSLTTISLVLGIFAKFYDLQ
jgi:hypothetical protein